MSHSLIRFGKRLTSAVLPSLLLALLVSCGGGGDSTPPPDAAQPVFTSQPASQTVVAGTQITFAATATGNAPIAYQWQRNGVDIPGATDSQYSIVTQESDTSSVWTVKASNGTPTPATSQSATLTVTPAGPGITLLAGDVNGQWPSNEFKDGTGSEARFFGLAALTVDREGNVYVTDNSTVRKITRNGVVSTVAGALFVPGTEDGPGPSARLATFQPSITADAQGNLFVLNMYSFVGRTVRTIRKVDKTGAVSTISDTSQPGSLVPLMLAADSNGNIYAHEQTSFFINSSNSRLRKISPDGTLSSFSPGYVSSGYFFSAGTVTVNAQDQVFSTSCVSDMKQEITRFDAQGNPTSVAAFDGCWDYLAVDKKGDLYGAASGGLFGKTGGSGAIAKFVPPNTQTYVAGGASLSTMLGPLPGTLGTIRGLAFGPDGSLFAIANNAVVQIRLP